jgi:hypothetical protein
MYEIVKIVWYWHNIDLDLSSVFQVWPTVDPLHIFCWFYFPFSLSFLSRQTFIHEILCIEIVLTLIPEIFCYFDLPWSSMLSSKLTTTRKMSSIIHGFNLTFHLSWIVKNDHTHEMSGIVHQGLTLATHLSSIMTMHTVMPCTCPCTYWPWKKGTAWFF